MSCWLIGTAFLIICARFSRNVHCVDYVSPPVIVECWLLLINSCEVLTLWLADSEGWPWLQCMICYVGADSMKWILLSKIWLLPRSLFLCTACGAKQVMLWCGLKPATGCAGSRALWETLWCMFMSDAICNSSWDVWSYEAIYAWCLPLLGLGVHENVQGACQGWLPPISSIWKYSKRSKAPKYLPLPANYL